MALLCDFWPVETCLLKLEDKLQVLLWSFMMHVVQRNLCKIECMTGKLKVLSKGYNHHFHFQLKGCVYFKRSLHLKLAESLCTVYRYQCYCSQDVQSLLFGTASISAVLLLGINTTIIDYIFLHNINYYEYALLVLMNGALLISVFGFLLPLRLHSWRTANEAYIWPTIENTYLLCQNYFHRVHFT